MLATSKIFKNAYLLELSYWTEGMPLDHYHKFVKRYQFFNIPKQFTKPEVISPIRNDLGEVGAKGVSIVDLPEMSQGMTFKGCIGCLECAENCPENALVLDSSSGKDRFIIKYPLCYGLSCRKCEKSCPEKVFSYLGLITGKTEEPRTDD